MARGFESKSVESQQTAPLTADTRERLAPDELERRSKRESLQMSRRRIEGELAAATSDVRRVALQNALRYLDEELGKL